MSNIDKAILDSNNAICKNIELMSKVERGFLSQNILSQLRNFVEYIIQKIYFLDNSNPNDYKEKNEAINCLKSECRRKYNFLKKFHDLLQKSVSHYTFDENGSERLMIKYYEYLLKLKLFLRDEFDLNILQNIEQFPINLDSHLMEYYQKIAERIEEKESLEFRNEYTDRYYIQKIKPFFVNKKIYYEVTFTIANDNVSKFDRVIAFTDKEILGNYAVKLLIGNSSISIMKHSMPIQIITDWEVSIRPCELQNFSRVFGPSEVISINTSSKEYNQLMQFIKDNQINLVDIVTSSDQYYKFAKIEIFKEINTPRFERILDSSRDIIINKREGYNTLRYLLYRLNNKIIKKQTYRKESCSQLSNLYLNIRCVPFEKMPFNTSLVNHNPRIFDLLDCIDVDNREHEFLARKIRNNTETKGIIFTSVDELDDFRNILDLQEDYNSKVYYKHQGRKLEVHKNHIYIKENAENCKLIIEKLKELSRKKVKDYTAYVEQQILEGRINIDCEEKRKYLREMFENSCVALIYGSAGTGKSTLINHISQAFSKADKLYLTKTHPAINNLKRRINIENCRYMTIDKFLSLKDGNKECNSQLLFVDECSTVSNFDMVKILNKAKFTLLILVGDVFQIQSIQFGNWFNIIPAFLPRTSISLLTKQYRSDDEQLQLIWNRVRKSEDSILEALVKNDCSKRLDDSIFEKLADDEIILCLNYDGLYGINNINRFLQSNNSNSAIEWGVNTFKIGDPILFNESKRFDPLIYNNLKGKILGIVKEENRIRFDIEVEMIINGIDAEGYDFELLELSKRNNSVIRFWVNKNNSSDYDDEDISSIVPFQVSYAVSIHKAQGLEYKSVKIVITHEVEELITHNIFYTAITRAKEKLNIYWTPETEKKVLDNIKDVKILTTKDGIELKNNGKDVSLIKGLYNIK
ncbi:MAG: AAA family ATPase [Eubacteriales bacterium]|nr:AAA family ATPase [Eubacteriales bacterium]